MEIRLHDVSTGYGRRVVASGLNACLHQGDMVCLLGANGAGKSTLLRTIGGFQPALAGEVSIDGKPTDRLGASRLNRLLSVVLTERIDVAGLTVRDLVGMGRAPYTGFWGTLQDDDRRIVDESMRLAGVAELADRQVQSLSDGERQKAVIAKALAQQTPAILLDEPTAFLDYPSKVGTLRLLSRLAHDMQKTVLLSTHDVEMALQRSRRFVEGGLADGLPGTEHRVAPPVGNRWHHSPLLRVSRRGVLSREPHIPHAGSLQLNARSSPLLSFGKWKRMNVK